MHTVDPEFKMSYDIRNDQEANVVARRSSRQKRAVRADKPSADSAANTCPMFGADGVKWMCLTGLAFVGFGVGLQLGIDQYKRYKRSSSEMVIERDHGQRR